MPSGETRQGASSAVAASTVARGAAATATPLPEAEDGLSAPFIAVGLEAALGIRAPGLCTSTPMVRQLSVQICRALELEERQQRLADVCALVRDIGMVGLPDAVVLATAGLSPADWDLVNHHPVIGAELLSQFPGLTDAAEIVRSHHERWDGEGYPDGKRGEEIPLLSRVIAAADAFVAMATDRPYRRSAGAEAALERVYLERGRQFDPKAVDALVEVLGGDPAAARTNGASHESERAPAPPAAERERKHRLRSMLEEFDVIPAFRPAHDRTLALLGSEESSGSDLVGAIESDTGLTIAVLKRAQELSRRRPVTNVADAVAKLARGEIQDTIEALPCAAFPWRTAIEAQLHQIRVHGHAVARAADRIARDVGLKERDDLIVAALLHDVGKLVLARRLPSPEFAADVHTAAPEERVRIERRELGMDHADLGALLLERWGLPEPLSDAVAAHHSAESGQELATFVRLADLVARHVQGDAVNRRTLLRLASACGLSISALRDALFELPHAGGSQRRRAEPSPLSDRETAVLRGLAEGKVYKQIASDLGIASSTIRTHLHNTYAKLGVGDRAQAVLRATEMAWI